MRKHLLISLFVIVALGVSAQQMNTGSSGDYKHPQMAQKAQAAEAEKLAKDTTTQELVLDQNPNYKDQTNNTLKVKGKRPKQNSNSPSNTDRRRSNADYKHANGLW